MKMYSLALCASSCMYRFKFSIAKLSVRSFSTHRIRLFCKIHVRTEYRTCGLLENLLKTY